MTQQKQLEAIEKLTAAITHLESQRAILGDAVVDASIAALRDKLAALEPLLPPEQQRKQVTVLFADVSGFTAMTEAIDVEDVRETINALWTRLDQVITEHGGHIDKHMGDAVMAIWGVETAREDDPERAVRAALAMQAETQSFNAVAQQVVPLHIRSGVSTGLVVLGEVGTTGEYTAIGDTVNLASRLEDTAPPGGILIAHDTYRHVRGLFDVQVLDPIQVKGKAEPVQVYLVEQAKPRAFRVVSRGVESVETRMIGREIELAYLQDALRTVMAGKHRMVTMIGEAGVGKSRLLYEFEDWAELLPERVRYYRGRASQEMQKLPYALIRDLFAFRFQIQDSDPPQEVRRKIEQGISDAFVQGRPDQAACTHCLVRSHLIGQLLGFDFSDSPHLQGVLGDPKQLHDRGLISLSDYFKAVAAQLPSMILLEDLHWADDSSLDLLDQLSRALRGLPLLIVCAARPVLLQRRPQWGRPTDFSPGEAEGLRTGEQTCHYRLELRPLSKQDSRRLVEEILRKVEEVPVALRELVVSMAEGNPFYVEELIKMLIEDGVIVKGTERWRVESARLTSVRVPPTLTGVLQARLDCLPAKERAVLQQASVVGHTFWDRAIVRINESAYQRTGALGEELSQSEIDTALLALQGKEMIFRREDSAFARAEEYVFKHVLLREVTYESVLKRLRRAYHAIAAEWLMEGSGERVGEYTGLIADHLELSEQTERAVTYLRRAGQQAAAQFANNEALSYLSRALDLIPEADTTERYALLLASEEIYDLQGERQAQSHNLEALEELAEVTDDDERRAEVALRQAHYAEVTGDYGAAVAAAQTAIDLAQRVRAADLEVRGHLLWGRALGRQGAYESAQPRFKQALALAQAARQASMEADCLRNLGLVSYHQGNYSTARDYLEQALQVYRETTDRQNEGATLNSLGAVSYGQGDYAQASAYFEQALRLHRETGNRLREGEVLNNLGALADGQGNYARARTYFEQALHLKREIGDRRGESATLNNLGVVSNNEGDHTQARAYWEQALHIKRELGDRRGEEMILTNLSLLSHRSGDDLSAQEYSQQVLLIAQELGDRLFQGYAWTNLGHALAGLEQLDEAAAAYQRALALWEDLDQPGLTTEPRAGLARVSLAQHDLTQARAHVEEILRHLETQTLDGAEEPLRVLLTCYQVLRVEQDPRAQEILSTAHSLLQEQAAKISQEETRRSFLESVPTHREIIREFLEKLTSR